VVLRDYSDKPIHVANLTGEADSASLEQPFPEGGANYSLDVIATLPSGQLTSGDFRLVVGVNAPEVLEGEGEPNSESLLKLAIPVMVGIKLQQIVTIDQPNEIMNNVGTLSWKWTDPELAFNRMTAAALSGCTPKTATTSSSKTSREDGRISPSSTSKVTVGRRTD